MPKPLNAEPVMARMNVMGTSVLVGNASDVTPCLMQAVTPQANNRFALLMRYAVVVQQTLNANS
jgi:hypothetical protein